MHLADVCSQFDRVLTSHTKDLGSSLSGVIFFNKELSLRLFSQ